MKREGRGLGHAPPLTAAPAIRAVRLTAAPRSVRTKQTEKKKFTAKSSAKGGRTALKNRKNCARSHIPLGPPAVKQDQARETSPFRPITARRVATFARIGQLRHLAGRFSRRKADSPDFLQRNNNSS